MTINDDNLKRYTIDDGTAEYTIIIMGSKTAFLYSN
jgi:hypothetical protein